MKIVLDTNVIVSAFINPRGVKDNGEYVIAESQNIKFDDEDDKVFFDVYKSSDANYIITGNKKHFPQDKNIITPREFIEMNNR